MQEFGPALKTWRKTRRMSQLDLALAADVSSRHISFLETGRARPSREMILHLSDVLEVPRPRRNDLLVSAGFAELYARTPLDAEGIAPVRAAMDLLIQRHDPYPAIVKDPLWTIVAANRSATFLFGAAGLQVGDSMLDFLCRPGAGPSAIENWGEIGHHIMTRLRNESRAAGGLAALDAAADILARDPQIAGFQVTAPLPPIVSTVYIGGGMRLPLFSTYAQFGGAEDLSLTELNIELMFPADEAAAALLSNLA